MNGRTPIEMSWEERYAFAEVMGAFFGSLFVELSEEATEKLIEHFDQTVGAGIKRHNVSWNRYRHYTLKHVRLIAGKASQLATSQNMGRIDAQTLYSAADEVIQAARPLCRPEDEHDAGPVCIEWDGP